MRRLLALRRGGGFLQSLKKSLLKNRDLQEAKRLHSALITSGCFHHTNSLAPFLVQFYAVSGSLREALLLFHSLPRLPSLNLACNAILRAHLHASLFSQAIHFFNHIVSTLSFVPDNYTCPLIFTACSSLSSLEDARNVHRLISSAAGFHPNAYTKCALIDMFAKCGSLEDARKVFDEMLHRDRDLACWTAMICGTIRLGHADRALSLFTDMMRAGGGLRPDIPLVAAVLPACGRLQAAHTGMALQGLALKSGFHDDLFVANATIDMYCKLGDTEQAHTVFRRMLCRDDVSWGTLIAGYSCNADYHFCIEVYAQMMSLGIFPSAVVVASVLPAIGKLGLAEDGRGMHGLILKRGFDSDVVVGSALMEMYSRCGLMGEMRLLLSVWSDWDVMIWNSAISSVEDQGLGLSIFRKMWESKFKPNSITLMSILPICTKMGAHKQGKEIHCYAIRNGLDMAVSVCNSVVDMYCKCGFLGVGQNLFDRMVERDIVSYNTIISSYGFHGHAKQALLLFDEMKSLAMRPSGATFVGLLSACSHAGLVDEGRSLYRSMVVDYGIQPNVEHYSCMVDLLGRAGRIGNACDFIRAMPEEPNASVLGCLLAACRLHNVDLIGEDILEDKLDDSGYHILISNMYASRKRWRDASRARALIKEKGLRKKPGKSWMQIGHHTHVFDAGDATHFEFGIIQETLKILFTEMRKGYNFDNLFAC
ncbi:pentatricopeptide repeat-containing protein At3g16610-like [Salvia hispanica]|uniref:pentatricopeptide repeat-containing protein At3g16610-like n=1 Tax=Salvia hispanica TaxID=49212 RepID=UPI002008F41E|nr:pentatricopeptide repeat-containing protein At3g16610-like [Salvia hispanica]